MILSTLLCMIYTLRNAFTMILLYVHDGPTRSPICSSCTSFPGLLDVTSFLTLSNANLFASSAPIFPSIASATRLPILGKN